MPLFEGHFRIGGGGAAVAAVAAALYAEKKGGGRGQGGSVHCWFCHRRSILLCSPFYLVDILKEIEGAVAVAAPL